MKVTFSTDNNKNIVVLPYVLDDTYSIDYGSSNNEELDSAVGSTIMALGGDPLASVSFTGVFPARKESWMNSEMLDSQEYAAFFRDCKKDRTILRLVITRDNDKEVFNRLVAITSLKIDVPATNGDIPYDMELTEYRKASTKKV